MEDKIKEIFEKEKVPESISPENIAELLKEKSDEISARKKQRRRIKFTKFAAIAAVFAIISVGAYNFAPHNKETLSENNVSYNTDVFEDSKENLSLQANGNYMQTAESYEQIYNAVLKKYNEKVYGSGVSGFINRIFGNEKYTNGKSDDTIAEIYTDGYVENESAAADTAYGSSYDESGDFSNTYNQVQEVEESDIIKTDGKNIFYLSVSSNALYCVQTCDDGSFEVTESIELFSENTYTYAYEMYLYNDTVAVIASRLDAYSCGTYDIDYTISDTACPVNGITNVLFYKITESGLEQISDYSQGGYYVDSRLIDNRLYLITNQDFYTLYGISPDNTGNYIPSYFKDGCQEYVSPESIYIPENWADDYSSFSYMNIAGIDLNSPDTNVSVKSLAGYAGDIYCSAENLYISSYDDGYTYITRFSVSDLEIVPAASGKVYGYVLNQFSMDEYDGFFRIAVSGVNSANAVYVLDLSLQEVGSIEGFAVGETIKSVNFSGDIGYVVTYEQTDPLFAIDFSNPCDPCITDDFKITGYSSYMQNWSDGLMLGFGTEGDAYGNTTGIKLAMFDISESSDIQTRDIFSILRKRDDYYTDEFTSYISSNALYDRKSLLIDGQKNIIGMPFYEYSYDNDDYNFYYYVLNYQDDKFNLIGSVEYHRDNLYYDYDGNFNRAVYIGDVIYIFSDFKLVSMDLNTGLHILEYSFE